MATYVERHKIFTSAKECVWLKWRMNRKMVDGLIWANLICHGSLLQWQTWMEAMAECCGFFFKFYSSGWMHELLGGHTDGCLACYIKSLVSMLIQSGMRQPTRWRRSAAAVRCVTVEPVCVYMCVCVCVCEPRTTVGAQPLCCDNRFDSNQCPTESINPFSFCKNTHLRVCARTREQTCGMPARFWTAASSEQASLPTGNLEVNPKENKEKKALLFFASASLSPPPPTLCVSVTHQHTLSLALPFSLFLCASSVFFFFSPSRSLHLSLSQTVSRLHCSLSQCQGSASEPQVKH